MTSKNFTKMDLSSGYFQIAMALESRKYTAFICELRLFEYVNYWWYGYEFKKINKRIKKFKNIKKSVI